MRKKFEEVGKMVKDIERAIALCDEAHDNLRKAVEMAVDILESWGYASEELENGLSSLQSGIDKMSEHV